MVKNKRIITYVVFLILICLVQTSFADNLPSSINISLGEDGIIQLAPEGTVNQSAGAWGTLISKYKAFIVGFAGIAAVTMVGLFIKNFIVLGSVANNPQAREQALKGLLVTGIATALLGSVATVTALFYGVFQ